MICVCLISSGCWDLGAEIPNGNGAQANGHLPSAAPAISDHRRAFVLMFCSFVLADNCDFMELKVGTHVLKPIGEAAGRDPSRALC